MIHSIIIFFVICLGLGNTVLGLCKVKINKLWFEHLIAILAVGFATFSFLGVILNILHIPLYVYIFLIISLIYSGYCYTKKIGVTVGEVLKTTKWKDFIIPILVIVIFITHLLIIYNGSMNYPYLEDDDPWAHASATKYVSDFKTYTVKDSKVENRFSPYLEPYPPTYNIIIGVMNQIINNVNISLKFYNSLIISLSLLFFYIFTTQLFNKKVALYGTFVLAIMPSYMSHFIWSHSLAVTLMFPAFYCIIRGLKEKEWRIPSIICIASMMVSHPFVSFLFGLLFMVFLIILFVSDYVAYNYTKTTREFDKTITMVNMGLFGLLLSMIYWGEQVVKWGKGVLTIRGGEFQAGQGWLSTYALQKYSIKMLLFPSHLTRIDQPVGFGWVIMVLGIIGLIFILFNLNRKQVFISIWFLLTFFLLMSVSFGLNLPGVSRAWVYVSIPLAMIIGFGLYKITSRFVWPLELIIILFVGSLLLYTPGMVKIKTQTNIWAPGAMWKSAEELQGYVSLSELEPNTMILPLCKNRDLAVGFGMNNRFWDRNEVDFVIGLENKTVEEINKYLKKYNYKYVIFDISCIDIFKTEEKVNNMLMGLISTNKLVYNNKHFYLIEV